MSSSEFTHGQYAQRRRADKARELTRWCYQRGIGPAVVEQPPQVLRAAARAAGVSPPHLDDLGRSPTWQLVGELLGARAGWDRSRDRQPPSHVPCVGCAVLPGACPRHVAKAKAHAARCCSCSAPLDPAFTAAGMDLHPSCEEPSVDGPVHEPAAEAPLF